MSSASCTAVVGVTRTSLCNPTLLQSCGTGTQLLPVLQEFLLLFQQQASRMFVLFMVCFSFIKDISTGQKNSRSGNYCNSSITVYTNTTSKQSNCSQLDCPRTQTTSYRETRKSRDDSSIADTSLSNTHTDK